MRARLAAIELDRALSTERQHAAEDLRRSEQRYFQLVESAFDGVAILQTGVAHSANLRLASLLGYVSAAELKGKRMEELVHPEDWPPIPELHFSHPGTAGSCHLSHPIRLQRKDGTAVWVELNSNPIDWEGTDSILCVIPTTIIIW